MTQEGLKSDFTTIFERENDAIFRYCYWRVSNRELAVDLTQETFARLWSEMNRGKIIDNPKPFLYLVAKRLIIDWYRKSKSLSLESLYEDEDNPFDPKDEEAHLAIEKDSDTKRVLSLVKKLDASYQEVLQLRFIEGLPPRDIAKVLRIGANVVSVRLTRAMRALRELAGIDIEKL